LGNQCNNGICDDVLDQCVGQPKTDGTICNDGLYCTQVDTCEGGQCLGSSDPCSDNTTYCDGVEYCAEDIAGYLCTSTGNPCGLLACNEFGGICTGSEVILSIASALGYAGTMDIELDNSAYLVGSVHLDVCDIDQRSWLNIDSANCSTTARSSAFSCGVIALGGGCVHVDLTTATGFIDIGTGAVARLNYTIDSNAPLTDYADINPEVIDIKDDNGTTLSVTPLPGTVRAVECVADADCNDNNICTDDTCAANACQYANNTNTCDDGLYCTDNDTCSGGTCGGIAHDCTGAGDQCNDGICDEALDQCVVQPKANGTICNDGLYCTDNDICAAGVCGGQAKDCAGAGDECNDGICDEALDQCVGQPKANGTICDDGLYCNGSDTCIGGICSSHSGTPCPDDGLYCNGSESCDEAGDQCLHSGSPCSETECNTCQEATDSCFDVAGTSCADDGNICTDDQCDGSGTCVHLNNTVPCEDGLYCTINDICSGGACLSGLARNCGGAGDECNDGICDDAIDQCVGQPKANGTVCDDGLYCTLNDTCSGGTCAGTARDCTGAGDQCNYGICDDTIDQCVGQPKANGTVCDDGLYCSLIDICSGGVCTSAMARDCSGLGDQCNDGICDEGLDQCVVQLKQDGTICNDGQYCNGSDTCIGGVCSIHSGVPCPDDGLYCNGSESCDEAGDQCSHSGSPCSGPSVCVEGIGQYECSTQWARHYRGSNEDFAQSVRQTSDGGYILAGYSNSFGTGGENALIMKFSSDGNVSWQKTYGGSSYDRANMIQQTSDGGYIFSGFTLSFGSGGEDAWAVKLDSNGDVSWQKTYGGISDDRANAILQTSDGGYVMTGYTNSFGLGGSDAWVVKLDISGNVTWQKTYGVDNNDYFDYIQQTWDGGYIVVGRSDSFGTIGDNIWVLRLNSSGNINWQKFYDWSINGRVYVIRQTSDGGYIMAGYTNSFGAGGDDVWVLKLNSSGNVSWQKTYGGASEEKCSDIQNTSDGGYVLAGYTLSFGNNQKRDFWILKINTNGGVDWGKTYGSPENDFAASIQQTMDGGYVVAGRSYSFGSGDSDLWVLKLDAFGDINVCDIIGNCNAVVNDSSISFQQTLAGANISSATVTNISYLPQNSSPTIVDICYPNPNDIDGDGTLDNFDNCIEYPNALDLGSCVKAVSGVYAGTGIACTVVSSCATGEICQKNQEDFNLNGIGDACECYADLSGDGRINSSDLLIMKIDYNRNNCYVNPCDADCNDDGKVNSSDLLIMKIQYRRTDCPVL
jgi:uncharacterized delta-60 repeat protein